MVVVTVHTSGPAPNSTNDNAASHAVGHASVASIAAAASTDINGPSSTAAPNGNARVTRVASVAPISMPAP